MGNNSLGVTFASFQALGLDVGRSIAGSASEMGFDSFWTAETVGEEAFATLAAVGVEHPNLNLGTGVLAIQLRTPMLAAMGAATLQSVVPEREVYLGVGVSSPVVVGRWHGEEYGSTPIGTMREYIQLTRACLSGESVSHVGAHYTASRFRLGVRLGEQRPKIVLGALNQQMLRTAGELADGVLLNYLPASAVPWCIEQVRHGEQIAGREPGECHIHAYVHVGVCDPEAARKNARKDLFSYAVVPAYAQAFERAGFSHEVEAVRTAHAAKDREAALAAISEEMIDAIDICGDAETVASATRAYYDAGVDNIVIMPLPWGEDRVATIEATLEAVKPT
jgi:probable F420-dependent oxidoreductase